MSKWIKVLGLNQSQKEVVRKHLRFLHSTRNSYTKIDGKIVSGNNNGKGVIGIKVFKYNSVQMFQTGALYLDHKQRSDHSKSTMKDKKKKNLHAGQIWDGYCPTHDQDLIILFHVI